jgi:hypothetical protein
MKWVATPFCFFSSDSASLDLSMSRKEKARSGRVTGNPEVIVSFARFGRLDDRWPCKVPLRVREAICSAKIEVTNQLGAV